VQGLGVGGTLEGTMNPLRELLNEAVVSVPPTATVREAAKAMAAANVGCVVILEEGKLVGLFTERDLLKRVMLKDLRTDQVKVAQVMTRKIITAKAGMLATDGRRLLREHHIRHLPVVDRKGDLLGILSIRDLIRDEVRDARQTVKDLHSYIQGGPHPAL